MKEGFDLPRAIGMDGCYRHLRDVGWTGPDIESYREKLESENFEALDEFSGGELSKLRGSAIFKVLLSATALRYAMEQTEAGGAVDMPPECEHGFRMRACNKCLSSRGVVWLEERRKP